MAKFKKLTQFSNDLEDGRPGCRGEGHIIDMHRNNDADIALEIYIYTGVRSDPGKTELEENFVHPLVPQIGPLFQTIDTSLQLGTGLSVTWFTLNICQHLLLKALRELHIEFCIDNPM